jgi:PRTRC genetic system protein A
MHILQPYFRVAVASKDDFEEAQKQNFPEIFMITSDGVYKHHRLGGIGSERYVCAKVPNIPGYELMVPPKQETKFLPAGKVPGELFDQIVSLYREVMRVNNGRNLEAMAWILWNSEQGYFIHVPKQQVSGASVNYEWDIPEGSIVVVDTHSHNSMGAFFSGTDDGDDRKGVRYSGVVGKLTTTTFEMIWRFCYQGKFFEVKFDEIFAPPRAEVNPDWLGKIETNTWNHYQGYGYQGRGNQSGSNGTGMGGATGGTTGRQRSTEHLKPYQFQPGQGRAGAGANTGNGTGNNTRPNENAYDFDEQYAEYYSRMSGQAAAGTGTGQTRTPTPTGRPVYDQRTRVATTIDPSAYDNSSRTPAANQENRGNAVAGTPTASTAVTVIPAKGGEAVIVGEDGQPLKSTSEKLTTAQLLLADMEKVHAGVAGANGTATESKPISDAAKTDWSGFPKSKDFVDKGNGELAPLGGPVSGEPLGTKVNEILAKVPHEMSEEEADAILRNLANRAMWESGGEGFDYEGFLESGIGEPVVTEETGSGIDVSGFETHPRFSEIAVNYGTTVANAFCLVNELSVEFSGGGCDELVMEIVSDFFQFLSGESALKTFRSLYELLSAKDQAEINSRGI